MRTESLDAFESNSIYLGYMVDRIRLQYARAIFVVVREPKNQYHYQRQNEQSYPGDHAYFTKFGDFVL